MRSFAIVTVYFASLVLAAPIDERQLGLGGLVKGAVNTVNNVVCPILNLDPILGATYLKNNNLLGLCPNIINILEPRRQITTSTVYAAAQTTTVTATTTSTSTNTVLVTSTSTTTHTAIGTTTVSAGVATSTVTTNGGVYTDSNLISTVVSVVTSIAQVTLPTTGLGITVTLPFIPAALPTGGQKRALLSGDNSWRTGLPLGLLACDPELILNSCEIALRGKCNSNTAYTTVTPVSTQTATQTQNAVATSTQTVVVPYTVSYYSQATVTVPSSTTTETKTVYTATQPASTITQISTAVVTQIVRPVVTPLVELICDTASFLLTGQDANPSYIKFDLTKLPAGLPDVDITIKCQIEGLGGRGGSGSGHNLGGLFHLPLHGIFEVFTGQQGSNSGGGSSWFSDVTGGIAPGIPILISGGGGSGGTGFPGTIPSGNAFSGDPGSFINPGYLIGSITQGNGNYAPGALYVGSPGATLINVPLPDGLGVTVNL